MSRGISRVTLTVLVAVSMMAASAVPAHAEGKLRINGSVLKEGEVAEMEGASTEGGKLVVPGLGITINCPKAKLKGNAGNIAVHTHGIVFIDFSECKVEGTGKTCTIYPTEKDLESGTRAGVITVHFLHLFLFKLAFPLPKIKFRIQAVLEKITEWFYGGATCTLPESTEVSGVGVVSVPEPTAELTEHELNDASKAEEEELKSGGMKDIGLLYGKEPSEIVGGKIKVKLIGKFSGMKFSLD